MKLGIIGAGSWGDALASVFSKEMHVLQYSRRKDKAPTNARVKLSNNLSNFQSVKYILLVVPTQELKSTCVSLKPYLDDDCTIILCSKGLDIATGKLPSEIAYDIFPKNSIAVLSGPNFAEEINKGLSAVASLAAHDLNLASILAKTLQVANFKLFPTDEIYAVQFFGALKNVLAILCGFARGLSFGENEIAALITMGVYEISALASKKSGKQVSITNPGCIGDIILTCTSTTSRNTKFGMDMAKKYTGEEDRNVMQQYSTIEGRFTALALGKLDLAEYPLLRFSSQLLQDNLTNETITITKFRNLLFN